MSKMVANSLITGFSHHFVHYLLKKHSLALAGTHGKLTLCSPFFRSAHRADAKVVIPTVFRKVPMRSIGEPLISHG